MLCESQPHPKSSLHVSSLSVSSCPERYEDHRAQDLFTTEITIGKRVDQDRSTFGYRIDVVQGIDTRLKRMKGNEFHDSCKLR